MAAHIDSAPSARGVAAMGEERGEERRREETRGERERERHRGCLNTEGFGSPI